MSDAEPPKSYYDKVKALGNEQKPYDCSLSRSVQAVAFHHGLSQANVDMLVHLEFDTVLSFSNADPDGDRDQQGVFRDALGVFDSPVARRKVAFVIRRLCRVDFFAEVPSGFEVSTEPKSKKARLSKQKASSDGVGVSDADAASGSGGALGGADSAAAVPAVPAVPAVSASSAVKSKDAASAAKSKARVDFDSSDDSTDSDDSDDDDDAADDDDAKEDGDADGKKGSKTDKTPKDANSMVVEIGSLVSFLYSRAWPRFV